MRALAALGALCCVLAAALPAAETAPDFNAEVRPILSGNCFKCHGPDDKGRKAKLRLDVRDAATRPAKSGETAIVAHAPERSELIKRIGSADPDEVMPPPSTNKTLSAAQKDILRRWIAAGAEYQPHWAFVPPVQAPLPATRRAGWARNPIDRFVLARLEKAGLQPSPEADPYVLVRRVHLDLIGLPPTTEEAEAFVADRSPDAYERLVDRLLAQPQYGERWARKWLDLARYADTNGYEKDRPRSIWPYRDWVIAALNADMPFDQFTIKQLAGDLLPDASDDDRIATGFHRNTMLNEEGGIDPLEYRFNSMTDRVATTGKTWLGLTTGCAQCHTHKYDPITHREYYQLMAFMDNADEPQLMIRPADFAARSAAAEAKIAALVAELPSRFPVPAPIAWSVPDQATLAIASGERAERQGDGSWLLSGPGAERDTYTLSCETGQPESEFLRLEAFPDPGDANGGPGRSPSGNFVVTTLAVAVAHDGQGEPQALKLGHAEADFSQPGWDVKGAIDADAKSGWAVYNEGQRMDVLRTAVFSFDKPLRQPAGARLMVRIDQQFGERHTLRHFRISFGRKERQEPTAQQRQQALERAYAAWEEREAGLARPWTVLHPVEATTNSPFLTQLDDGSLLAGGDQTKSDTYTLKFRGELRGITALRLEVIPDQRLPGGGPGRVYYEGAAGDFGLSEFTASAGGQPLAFATALHSFAAGGNTAAKAIDGKADTIWSIDGGQRRPHAAVFVLATPLADAGELTVSMLFERYFAAGLGRFRLSATTAPPPAAASELPPELAAALAVPAAGRSPEQRQRLFEHWLLLAPELAPARAEIDRLRESLRSFPTTLVMQERPADHPRATFIHNRGEWLQPTERVEPGVFSFLNPLPAGAPRNRLGFARWLVAPDQPLTARVTVNRQWAAFFGRGLVRTVDDFGYQGDPPTHPELLDWLAVEFMRQGWSLKKLHRLIVTSATYRQDSRITPELLAGDPANQLLARGPRLRLDAEAIRDSLLRAAGLLSAKLGGPSVYPPQPASVSTEGAYGALTWKVSEGEDRYRRGLYTFSKRTAPYAMFNTFDGPSGESCVAQRETSDSPLQALTMLNDTVVLEAAQALGRTFAAQTGEPGARVAALFRRCLTRPPAAEEAALLVAYLAAQRQRFAAKELDPAQLAGPGEGDAVERAAWTALARVLLNTDEAITKD
jgi:mono/diheme cytochrome c family protein